MARLVQALAEGAPQLARLLDLGGNGGTVPALEFGAAGGAPLSERPAVFLVGGLDGVALEGGEAVLCIARYLLADSARLPAGVAFVAIPWASPEALEATRLERGLEGRNGRPLDEDRDGRIDEDPPDDVDGDGHVLDMLIEHPGGPWTRCRDGRFLVRARPGDQPRYLLAKEGRDQDGDGRFNEDGPGGVVLDLNFPLGRSNARGDSRIGPYPLSEAGARALADLALARRAAVVLLFQGSHGMAAAPGGAEVALPAAGDEGVYERVGELFHALTGRRQGGLARLAEARGEERPGAALDWFYSVVGALSLEVAPWGPRVEGSAETSPRDARFGKPEAAGPASAAQGARALEARPTLSEVDREWAQWLDNVHGGLGFSPWRPVELGGGVRALIGGWEPRTRANPPPESIAGALQGLPEFVQVVAQNLPRLEIRVVENARAGDVVSLRAQLKNLGFLPTGLAGARPTARRGAWLELELPAGAQLLAGEARVPLGRLAGQELSREAAWVVLAPPGSTFALRAGAEWAKDESLELRP